MVARAMSESIYEIEVESLEGEAKTLAEHRGKVLLVVTTASQCGFTPQFAGLEQLYAKYADRGFVVLGFPCNQFGQQEPGSNEQIKEFCSLNYSVTFPLFDKLDVNGEHRHPLYTALAGEKSPFPGNIGWNFEKFIIGKNGEVVARFAPKTEPDALEVTQTIEAELAK